MRKGLISIILFFLLTGIIMPSAHANENSGDSSPPVLHSLELTSKELNVGDTLEISADVTDDFSGVKNVFVNFHHVENFNKNHNIELKYDKTKDSWIGKYKISESDLNGKWRITSYDFSDTAGNEDFKFVKEDPTYKEYYYIVNNPNEVDISPPVVESIEISPKVVEIGQDIVIKVKAHDDTKIENMRITFKRPIEMNSYYSISDFTYDEENDIWIGKYTVQQTDVNGKWEFDSLNVFDNFQNHTSISRDDTIDIKQKSLEVKNPTGGDYTPPNIDWIELSKNVVSAHETISVKAKVSDDMSGISGVYIFLKPPSGNNIERSIVLRDNENDGIVEGFFTAKEFDEIGKWTIESIDAVDNVFNAKSYFPTDFDNHEELYLEVIPKEPEPALTNLEISNGEFEVGNTVTLSAEVIDNKFPLEFIEVIIELPSSHVTGKIKRVNLTYNEKSKKWIGSFQISDSDENGIWKLHSAYLMGVDDYYYKQLDSSFSVINPEIIIDDLITISSISSIGKRENMGAYLTTNINDQFPNKDLSGKITISPISGNNSEQLVLDAIVKNDLFIEFNIPENISEGMWEIKDITIDFDGKTFHSSRFYNDWNQFYVPSKETDKFVRENFETVSNAYYNDSFIYVKKAGDIYEKVNDFIKKYKNAFPPYSNEMLYEYFLIYADKSGRPYGDEVSLYDWYQKGLIDTNIEPPKPPILVYQEVPYPISFEPEREIKWFISEVFHNSLEMHNTDNHIITYLKSPNGKEYKINDYVYDKSFNIIDSTEFNKGAWIGTFKLPNNALNGTWKMDRVELLSENGKKVFKNGIDFYGATFELFDGQDIPKRSSSGGGGSSSDFSPPNKPVLNEFSESDRTLSGIAEAGSIITIKIDGDVIASEKVDDNGKFNIDIPNQKFGTEIVVTVTDAAGNVSKETKIKVLKDSIPFKDSDIMYKKEIDYLVKRGIINGYPNHYFIPKESLKRVHAIQMILREKGITDFTAPDPNFTDVKKGDYGYEEIAKAAELGIIDGIVNQTSGEIYFDPNASLTRGQLSKIMTEAYDLNGDKKSNFKDVKPSDWYYQYVNTLVENGIVEGFEDQTFRPNEPITREHFSVMLARYLNPEFKKN